MAPRPLSVQHRHLHHPGGGEYPPALFVPFEPVADRLSQVSGSRRLLTVLTPETGVIGIALNGRQQLLMPVAKPYSLNHQVLAVLVSQAVRQAQPQGQRAVVGNAGHS